MATKTGGEKVADLAYKAFAGTAFVTTVVSGGWFVATSISAMVYYDNLAKELDVKKAAEAAAEQVAHAARQAEVDAVETKRKKGWKLW
mmetsp:Transcript_43178/g.69486  ORF Transcript_43178/g.69486 Transcript_43178/m.69486 type:complete len:88 (+) Transcript_43178:326-589(+)